MLECILVICLAGFLFIPVFEERPVYSLLGWPCGIVGLYQKALYGFTFNDRRDAYYKLGNLRFNKGDIYAGYYVGLLSCNRESGFYCLENALKAFELGAQKDHPGCMIGYKSAQYLLGATDASPDDYAEFMTDWAEKIEAAELDLVLRALIKMSNFPQFEQKAKELLNHVAEHQSIPEYSLAA